MIRKASLCALNTTFVALYAPSVFAKENSDDAIIVTAHRFTQPLSSVLAPTTVVTREEIDRWQANSLTDVMRRLPGTDISQNGGLGQKSSLFIRGTNSDHVLILIDGIRLNQAGISGSSDLSQIPLSLVQRIEYTRGARSAVYGSDAIGGVVNIITKRNTKGSTLTATMGSNGYQSYDISSRQELSSVTSLTLAGNYTYTKGYDIVAGLPDAYGNPAQRDRDGFMGKTLYGGLEHQFSDEWSGFVRGYGFDNRTAYDGMYRSDKATGITGLPDIRQLYSQRWDSGLRFTRGTYSSQWIASYSHTKDYNYDPRLGTYSPITSLDNSKQYTMQWGNTLQTGNGAISAGADWQKQTTEPGTSNMKVRTQQRDAGFYVTTQQQLQHVTLEGALRRDNNTQFGWHSTWQSGIAWEFVSGYRLFASYGTAFKAPKLVQLYGSLGGNPGLAPEESKQWERGVEGISGPVDWRISGYRNDINHLIDYDLIKNRYYNINQAGIKGIEAKASFDTEPFSHQISWDYVDARDAKTNQRLMRRARQQVKYQLDLTTGDLEWSLTYHYLGQRYDTDFNTFSNRTVNFGGVSLWDLAVAYPVMSALIIHVRIANLLNKNYETAYGYQTPGRDYSFSASYSF